MGVCVTYLYSVKFIFEGVNYNEHIAEFSRQDPSAIVPPVLGPDNVDLVVT